MNRIPFEIVFIEADRLICLMAESSMEMASYYLDQYNLYIESCGWTNQEFDNELLKLIDNSWDPDWN